MSGPAELPWEQTLGVVPVGDGRAQARVWVPAASEVAIRVGGSERDQPLDPVGLGIWAATVEADAGDDYWVVIDGTPYPDPSSRSQPEGVRGPSRVVDSTAFRWTDNDWTPVPPADLVIYELHIGTFTAEGTFDAAITHLEELASLGITAIEIMPVAEFPGILGWGYDGVYLSAAQSSYGGPQGLARLVDAAHAAGLSVILDVVHNHLGPTGSDAVAAFGPYFTDKYATGWGGALNYDDADSGPVREWVLQSAEWFVRDLHIDGLRLDAIHAIFDQGARHLVAELVDRVHAARPGAVVIAESGLNDPKVIRPPELGGWGVDAQWADDFHHALRTLLTGDTEGWYCEFGRVADLAKTFERPFLHDGQYSTFRRRRFGAPAGDRPPEQFVVFSMNHDQVGNRALGDRLPLEVQPLAAFCTLLSPFTPMLFMGEEYGEQAPFQFFTDHIDPFIADATGDGRRQEFAAFADFAGIDVPDPQALDTFERSKLTRRRNARIEALYRDLLRVRRQLPSEETTSVFDEDARWLRVHRGPYQMVCNFSAESVEVPVDGDEVVITTDENVKLGTGSVVVPAMAGALIR